MGYFLGKNLFLDHTLFERIENLNQKLVKKINYFKKESSDLKSLAPLIDWRLKEDKILIEENKTLQIAMCNTVLKGIKDKDNFLIHLNNIGKFVVKIGDEVSPTDIDEGNRIAVDRSKYQIQISLSSKIDPQISLMAIEEKPSVSYKQIGGCRNQIFRIREVVEYPILYPKKFSEMGIILQKEYYSMVHLAPEKHW